MKLCVIPVETERPQIISNTPQNSGILKDSSIQVLFDHDMDESHFRAPTRESLLHYEIAGSRPAMT